MLAGVTANPLVVTNDAISAKLRLALMTVESLLGGEPPVNRCCIPPDPSTELCNIIPVKFKELALTTSSNVSMSRIVLRLRSNPVIDGEVSSLVY